MKSVISAIILAAFLLMLALPVSADDMPAPEDSLTISDALREELGASDSEIIVRVYSVIIIGRFSDFADVDLALQPDYDLNDWFISYAVFHSDGTVTHYAQLDGVYQPVAIMINEDIMRRFLSGELADVLGEDVEVQKAYYITEESDREGTAIYYRTNIGDYVYFAGWATGECLFPAEVFQQYQAELLEARIAIYGDSMVTGGSPEIWDLSSFRVDSPTFDPNAPIVRMGDESSTTVENNENSDYWIWIGIAVVVVAAVAAGCVILWKKRKTA